MGGFLQAILFGYTGFRITKNCLNFDPVCPDDTTKLKITGVCYLGSKLSFTITKEDVTIEVTWSSSEPQSSSLEAVLAATQHHFPLQEGQSVTFPTAAGWIQKAPVETV
uniref:Uncharacterized protein n=2 Tax=Sphaerodactylus townsendi TaxID=933632 RepID=A0ACB8G2Y4_9SAUR